MRMSTQHRDAGGWLAVLSGIDRSSYLIVGALLLLVMLGGSSVLAAQGFPDPEGVSDTARTVEAPGVIVSDDPFDGHRVGRDEVRITLGLELLPAPGGGSFFDGYALLFGRKQDLEMAVMPVLTGRIALSPRIDLAIGASWLSTELNEVYDAYGVRSLAAAAASDSVTLEPTAQVVEKLTLSAFPVMAGLEYSAVASPYRSYVGVALGGAMVSTTWTSDVHTFGGEPYFRPTTNTKGPGIAPVARIYTGLDLTFDYARAHKRLVQGIYIEASWFFLPIVRSYFDEVRANGEGLPFVPEEGGATLDAGGFTIGIGAVLGGK